VEFAAFAFCWRLTDLAARSGLLFAIPNFPPWLPKLLIRRSRSFVIHFWRSNVGP
jgi:hypothetical protein